MQEPRSLIIGVLLAWGVCIVDFSFAQCLSGLPEVPFDTSVNCASQPSLDRIFGTQILRWGDHIDLVANIGNEIKVWKIDDPEYPVQVTASGFNVGNFGDSDYDLYNFSVCDNCRFGIANYKMGTVLFDLGTGAQVSFTDEHLYSGAHDVPGAFTFRRNQTQYLIASGLEDSCASGSSTFYRFSGIHENDLQRIGCVEADGVNTTRIVGGFAIGDYLYLADDSTRIFLYRVVDGSPWLSLEYLSTPMLSYMIKDRGLAIDEDNHVAVSTGNTGLKVWDISDPGNPVLRSSVSGEFNRASLVFPLLFVARKGFKHSEETWDLSDRDAPVEVDPDFWSPSNPFNDTEHQCNEIQGGTISPGGEVLYLSRYSRLQMVDVRSCMGPVPPTPDLSMTPQVAFPGDVVAIADVSQGTVESSALWVTEGEDSAGEPVAGSAIMSSSPAQSVELEIAIDLSASTDYWAHVAVANEAFPYEPGSTPDQLLSRQVTIDRIPEAEITVAPEGAMTGETVTLTAVAQGHPAQSPGGSAYLWTLTPPQSAPFTLDGQQVVIDLDESGVWSVDLDVNYLHQGPFGGDVVAHATVSVDAFSVFADFDVSPVSPHVTEPLLLDAGSSRLAPDAMPSYQWTVTGPEIYEGCPSGPSAELCTIPAGTLTEGSYDFELTLTNLANGDVSSHRIEGVFVDDLSFSLSWEPVQPETGETVYFHLDGIQEVDFTVWDFGEAGCDETFPQVYFCTPLYTTCLFAAHQFASPGLKTVSVSAVSDGVTVGPVTQLLSVVEGGQCQAGDQTDPWLMVEGAGFAKSSNVCVASLEVYGNQIYAGSLNGVGGAELWRASAGGRWAEVQSGGFGQSSNTKVSALKAFGGLLYAATSNALGAEVFVSSDDSTWSAVATGGFGDTANISVPSMVEHQSQLIAATEKTIGGAEAFANENGSNWTQINLDGFGDPSNTAITAMVSCGGQLFAATRSSGAGFRLWKWGAGTDWAQLGNDGFGDSENVEATALYCHDRSLYLATANAGTGAQLWTSTDGAEWSVLMNDGFGMAAALDRIDVFLHDGTWFRAGGSGPGGDGGMWRSANGIDWVPSSVPGFGDVGNAHSQAAAQLGSALYVGTENPHGLQIWRLDGLGLFIDGFEDGSPAAWSATSAEAGP